MRRRYSNYNLIGVNPIARNRQGHANRDDEKQKDAEEVDDEGSHKKGGRKRC